MAIAHFYIVVARGDAKISWTNDLAVLAQLFETMCAPAADAGNSEEWCVELFRQVEHVINKAAVVVDVSADTFVDFALFGDHATSDFFDLHVEIAFGFAAFFFREVTYELTQYGGARIALGINSVAHAVDEAGTVEGAFIEERSEVFGDGFVIGPVGDTAFEVLEHMAHTNVGTAVAWPFERAKSAGNG